MTFQFVRAGERRVNPIHKLGLKPVAAAGEGTDAPTNPSRARHRDDRTPGPVVFIHHYRRTVRSYLL